MDKKILEIKNLSVSFTTHEGIVNAVRCVNLTLRRGETVAIVGESGCGKSVTAKAVMGILSSNQVINSGEILFTHIEKNGREITEDLLKLTDREIRKRIKGQKIAMVFQDPMTSLNPTMKIGKQLTEGMRIHRKMSKEDAEKRGIELLESVGIVDAAKRMNQYPHQLSGGMRQRVVIAIALACEPDILICDEPTTALDVTIQAKILQLIADIQKRTGVAVIFITHDLGVVAKIADYINVMYAGKIIEEGVAERIFHEPVHPYTQGLLASIPDIEVKSKRLYTIPGSPPNLLYKIEGDAFAPRNPQALNIDFLEEPPMFEVEQNHCAATWLLDPRAPKLPPINASMEEALPERIPEDAEVLLEVKNLEQHFTLSQQYTVKAVDGVDFTIHKGEIYGLVGESGSGKSTIGRSIIRLYDPTNGEIVFNKERIDGKLSQDTKSMLHQKMMMIFQDPMASLNPRKKVIDIIAEGLDANHLYKNKKEREEMVYRIMDKVGLAREFANRYPHQFSGGQRQRIGIARALVMNPALIIADEAISALDVSIQAQVVNLMKDIQETMGTSILFITHNLSMVKYISHTIGVLHLGHIVESGTTEEIFSNPIHPYTKCLISAIPRTDPDLEKGRKPLEYDYETSGIDYTKGTLHYFSKSHYVLGTDEEIAAWTK